MSSYFGVPMRNGLGLGLGTVAALTSTPPAAIPPVPAFILMEDGTSFILLEDGVSKILLE